ncbi:MAG: hypothetical protein U1B30_11605 [Pseudomonadota bacterium]|nr:hypothetical protein [Pseudomonadota bacterium]
MNRLLESGLLTVPDDFTERVMRDVCMTPLPTPRQRWYERLQWLALIGSAALGAVELLAFIFGLWTATTAY